MSEERISGICACGEHGFVGLTLGFTALVSPEDFAAVSARKWTADVRMNQVYAVRRDGPRGQQRRQYMHRSILGAAAGPHVDHANSDGIDNRRGNLRGATAQQNAANRRAQEKTSSPFKGVSFNKRLKKWHAYVNRHGKREHIGFFATEADAARAYDRAAAEVFGEFARTNESLGLFNQENAA